MKNKIKIEKLRMTMFGLVLTFGSSGTLEADQQICITNQTNGAISSQMKYMAPQSKTTGNSCEYVQVSRNYKPGEKFCTPINQGACPFSGVGVSFLYTGPVAKGSSANKSFAAVPFFMQKGETKTFTVYQGWNKCLTAEFCAK